MTYLLFKQEYWLTSPLAPHAVADAIWKDIADNGNKSSSRAYFKGTVDKNSFSLTKFHQTTRINPKLRGRIIATTNGSLIYAVSKLTIIDHLIEIGLPLIFAIAAFDSRKFWLIPFACIFYFWGRYSYQQNTKGDRTELKEILYAEEIEKHKAFKIGLA